MLRRVLMWLGVKPAWVEMVSVRPDGSGAAWFVDIYIGHRGWATEEDLQVVRTNALILLQKEFGRCRITRLARGDQTV